jgi:hypothetical protein
MQRHRSLIASFLLLAGIGFAVLPAEASIPSTWSRIKTLYGGQPDVIAGAAVTPQVARSAVAAVDRTLPRRWNEPVRVDGIGRSRFGRVLRVVGDDEAGVTVVNLVTDRGRYLSGVKLDRSTGTLTNLATGEVLWHGDLNDLTPDKSGNIFRDIAHRAADMACAGIANAVLQNCLVSLGLTSGIIGAAICFASAAAVLAACEAANHLDFYLEKGDTTGCACPRPGN